ncbi:MAG: MauE/DoxX family redox-associated membrane protein, partial [Gammaproteobacteria bacterium]
MAIAAVLGVAAVTKARHLAVFREQIADFRLLPYWSTKVAAPAIVAAEGLASVGLLVPAARREAAGLALLLFTIFLAALVAAWIQGRELECGCFGGSNELDSVGAHSVVRTVMFSVLAVVAG